MQDAFIFFNQGWVGSLIGIVGTILGIIGIFSYKISRSSAEPMYQKCCLRLLGREEDNLPKEVTVLFKGKEVDRLSKTTLILWNHGTEILDGKDVVSSDPITITFDGDDNILSYKILKKTKKTNKIDFVKNEQHILHMSFEYLDPGDGIILEILHDSEKRYPEITGAIKGLPKGFIDSGKVYSNKQYKAHSIIGQLFRFRKLMYITAILIGAAITVIGLLPQEIRELIDSNLIKGESEKPLSEQPIFFVIAGLLYMLLPSIMLWSTRKKYPKELEIDEIYP